MKRGDYFSFGIGLCFVIVCVFLFSKTIFGVRFNHIFSDRITQDGVHKEIVVVGIDDTSLADVGAWPWKRDIFAEAIQKLYARGARLVVFDVLFLEPRDGDDVLRKALTTLPYPVIFASKINETKDYHAPIYTGLPHTSDAVANVFPDEDGKVRSLYFFVRDKAGVCFPTLSYKAFLEYTVKKDLSCEDYAKPFVYQGYIPKTLSFSSILRDASDKRDLEGVVVFIGSTSLDLEDTFISRTGEKISGVYIHAAMLSQMMSHQFPVPLPVLLVIMIIVLSGSYVLPVVFSKLKAVYQYALLIGGVFVLISFLFGISSFGYSVPFSLILFSYGALSLYALMYRYGITERRSKHIRGLFSKYVHEQVLEELLKHPDIVLGGEKRHMSILFSDVRGFTTLSESLDPAELTTLLNDYFSAMTPHVLEEKGTIDKFIGDAIMAFWNAPLHTPEYCTHAVRSALRMQDALVLFNKEHNTTLAAGIGIHAGDVIVGNVGGKNRVNYTVLGDAVNLASRVEGLTKKYGVGCIVTEEVRMSVKDKACAFRKLDVITVKGKTKPTVLYEVRRHTKENEAMFNEYERAFEAYQEQDFNRALLLFKKVQERGDEPSFLMVERILSRDVSVPFDGVWHFDEK